MPSTLAQHHALLPPLPESDRASEPRPRTGEECPEKYFRDALACISPDRKRPQWLIVMWGFRDARITRADGSELSEADKYEALNEWSAAGATYDADTFDRDYNSTSAAASRNAAGLGSIDKLARADGYNGPPPTTTKPHPFKPVDGEAVSRDPADDVHDGYPDPLNAAELAGGDFPRVGHAWQDFILHKYVNLLYGDGGAGKTLLALHIAAAIAAGLPLFGRKTRQMPALLVLAEDDAGETKARLQAICQRLGVTLADLPLHVWCLPGHDVNLAHIADDGSHTSGPFMEPLRRKLDEIGPCLLVLDTVSDVAALDETKRLPVNTLCKIVLGGLCREFGATILVNAHPSKAAMADGSGYSGSTAWNNAVRSRLTLDRSGKGERRVLKVAKANYGSAAELELFLFGQSFLTVTECGQAERDNEERQAVLDTALALIDQGVQIVRGNGSGQKPADLAAEVKKRHAIDLNGKRVLELLNDLERAGELSYKPASKDRGARAGFCRPTNREG